MTRKVLCQAIIGGFGLLLAVCGSANSQTTFPVRLGPPHEIGVPTLQEGGGFKIQTTTQYQARIALQVTPNDPQVIFKTTVTQPDTTLSLHVIAFSGRSEVQGLLNIHEQFFVHTYNVDSAWNGLTIDGAKYNDAITILADLSTLNGSVTLKVTTPVLHDRLTLFIDLLASRPVTIEELF